MKIKEIDSRTSSAYLNKLRSLIDTTIDLPEEAKTSYKQQWTEQRIEEQSGKWLFLAALDDHAEITGLILGTPIEGGVGTIVWVLVDSTKQQKGIGSKLLDFAKTWYSSKGAHKLKLTVPDRKTVEFYTKQGMILEGEHRNHWWGRDFWAMGIILNQNN